MCACLHACAYVCVHVCTWGIGNNYNDSRFMCNELDIVTEYNIRECSNCYYYSDYYFTDKGYSMDGFNYSMDRLG